jgi:hypothetical protein
VEETPKAISGKTASILYEIFALVVILALLARGAKCEEKKHCRLYRFSQAFLVATTAADCISSRGLREMNPILGQNTGHRAAAMAASGAGILLLSHGLRRSHPGLAESINLVAGGAHTPAALWNWRQHVR